MLTETFQYVTAVNALTGQATGNSIRVRTHNQNMTVAAMQMAERNSSPHLS